MKNGFNSREGTASTVADSEFALRDGLIHVPHIYKNVSRNKMLSPDATQ